jgi:hypothetical protein
MCFARCECVFVYESNAFTGSEAGKNAMRGLGPILRLYRFAFARRRFFGFNEFIFQMALRGMGVLNYENGALSGEDYFLSTL